MEERRFRQILEEYVRLGKTNEMIMAYLKEDFRIEMKYVHKVYRMFERPYGSVPNYWQLPDSVNPLNLWLPTLKKYLKKFGIRRNDPTVSPAIVLRAIEQEQNGPGFNAGYRFLHNSLRNRHGLSVSRRTVRNVLSTMRRGRPFAAARAFPWQRCMRYCPGPNFRWSEDGHDKLGKFDIFIHAGIDEYSRRIMWLRAFVNNRQSDMIASYYIRAVREVGVVPHKTVSDFGRESTIIAQCQALFYSEDSNPASHHSWTFSVRNVTIESWWRRLRQMCTLYWHQEFTDLESAGQWSGDIVDRWALVSVYLPLINSDLDRTAIDHNMHRIRSQRGRIRPGGQPDDLYNLPEQFGGRRCGKSVSDQEIDLVEATFNLPDVCSMQSTPAAVETVVKEFLQRNRVEITRDNAKTLYLQVRALLNSICM